MHPTAPGAWLRHPLTLFTLVGLTLGTVDHLRNPPRLEVGDSIEVSTNVRTELRRDLERRLARAPTAQELAREVAQYVDDEVLFRTALRLGLHHTDVIVRRRLVQRMHFLHEEIASVAVAGAAPDNEGVTPQPIRVLRFEQVHFARFTRGGALHVDAEAARRALVRGETAVGDPLPVELDTADASEADVARALGPAAAAQISALAPGTWSQPIASAYGLHLVRVLGTKERYAPDAAARAAASAREAQRRRVEGELLAQARQTFGLAGTDGASP